MQDDWDWQALRVFAVDQARRHPAPGVEPEDVAQDAILKAWRHRASCRRQDAPRPWVAAIVRQEAARRAARICETPVGEVHDDRAVAPDLLDDLAPRLDLERAMRPLSREDRQLLWLRYDADMTQPAAAAALGLPEGTAKVRLYRLRLRLRAELEDA